MSSTESGQASLPVELIVRILTISNFSDIIQCRAVSKQFKSIVDTVRELEYKVELGVAGYIDAPQHPCHINDRLRLLRESLDCWNRPRLTQNPTTSIDIPITNEYHGMYHGNVFVRPTRAGSLGGRQALSGMECIAVRRSTDGVAFSNKWTLSFSFEFLKYAVDPRQNLIALLTPVKDPVDTFILRTCSLLDGSIMAEKHLDMKRPGMYTDSGGESGAVRIHESLVAIVITQLPRFEPTRSRTAKVEPGCRKIMIIDWKAGILVATESVRLGHNVDLAFLSNTFFLLSFENEEYSSIEVYGIQSNLAMLTIQGTTSPAMHIASYRFPDCRRGSLSQNACCQWTFCSTFSDATSVSPFEVAPSSRMLRVRRLYESCPPDPHRTSFEWFIHPLAFFKCLEGRRKQDVTKAWIIPWDSWGPSFTRCFKVPRRQVSGVVLLACHGSRVLRSMHDSTAPLSLLDFNQVAIAREINAQRILHSSTSSQSQTLPNVTVPDVLPGSSRIVTEPTVISCENIFVHDFETRLPYRRTDIHYGRGEAPSWVFGGDPLIGEFNAKENGPVAFQYSVLDP